MRRFVLLLCLLPLFAAALLWEGRSSRARGIALIAAYAGVALAFFLVGDRNP